MSRYEAGFLSGLILYHLVKAKEAYQLLECKNVYVASIRTLAADAMKMNFIWAFEAIQFARSIVGLEPDFPFKKMHRLRNRLTHGIYKWDEPEYIERMVLLFPEIERLAATMAA
jgi:uncharacterized protein with HEPN domain